MDKLAEAGYWFSHVALELTVLFLVITFLVGIIRTYLTPERARRTIERRGK